MIEMLTPYATLLLSVGFIVFIGIVTSISLSYFNKLISDNE